VPVILAEVHQIKYLLETKQFSVALTGLHIMLLNSLLSGTWSGAWRRVKKHWTALVFQLLNQSLQIVGCSPKLTGLNSVITRTLRRKEIASAGRMAALAVSDDLPRLQLQYGDWLSSMIYPRAAPTSKVTV
jgi:hypothetical protein